MRTEPLSARFQLRKYAGRFSVSQLTSQLRVASALAARFTVNLLRRKELPAGTSEGTTHLAVQLSNDKQVQPGESFGQTVLVTVFKIWGDIADSNIYGSCTTQGETVNDKQITEAPSSGLSSILGAASLLLLALGGTAEGNTICQGTVGSLRRVEPSLSEGASVFGPTELTRLREVGGSCEASTTIVSTLAVSSEIETNTIECSSVVQGQTACEVTLPEQNLTLNCVATSLGPLAKDSLLTCAPCEGVASCSSEVRMLKGLEGTSEGLSSIACECAVSSIVEESFILCSSVASATGELQSSTIVEEVTVSCAAQASGQVGRAVVLVSDASEGSSTLSGDVLKITLISCDPADCGSTANSVQLNSKDISSASCEGTAQCSSLQSSCFTELPLTPVGGLCTPYAVTLVATVAECDASVGQTSINGLLATAKLVASASSDGSSVSQGSCVVARPLPASGTAGAAVCQGTTHIALNTASASSNGLAAASGGTGIVYSSGNFSSTGTSTCSGEITSLLLVSSASSNGAAACSGGSGIVYSSQPVSSAGSSSIVGEVNGAVAIASASSNGVSSIVGGSGVVFRPAAFTVACAASAQGEITGSLFISSASSAGVCATSGEVVCSSVVESNTVSCVCSASGTTLVANTAVGTCAGDTNASSSFAISTGLEAATCAGSSTIVGDTSCVCRLAAGNSDGVCAVSSPTFLRARPLDAGTSTGVCSCVGETTVANAAVSGVSTGVSTCSGSVLRARPLSSDICSCSTPTAASETAIAAKISPFTCDGVCLPSSTTASDVKIVSSTCSGLTTASGEVTSSVLIQSASCAGTTTISGDTAGSSIVTAEKLGDYYLGDIPHFNHPDYITTQENIVGPYGDTVLATRCANDPWHVGWDGFPCAQYDIAGMGFWVKTAGGTRNIDPAFSEDINTGVRYPLGIISVDANWKWVEMTTYYNNAPGTPRCFVTGFNCAGSNINLYIYGVRTWRYPACLSAGASTLAESNPSSQLSIASASSVGACSIASSDLNTQVRLTGTSDGVCTITGACLVSAPATGTSVGVCTATGLQPIAQRRIASATSAGVCACSGELASQVFIASASSTGTCVCSGEISCAVKVAAETIVCSGSASGYSHRAIPIASASSNGTSTPSAGNATIAFRRVSGEIISCASVASGITLWVGNQIAPASITCAAVTSSTTKRNSDYVDDTGAAYTDDGTNAYYANSSNEIS